ncbi:MAG: hypothetical protein V1837_07150 [Candidatus Woesearchaeota archaeon]
MLERIVKKCYIPLLVAFALEKILVYSYYIPRVEEKKNLSGFYTILSTNLSPDKSSVCNRLSASGENRPNFHIADIKSGHIRKLPKMPVDAQLIGWLDDNSVAYVLHKEKSEELYRHDIDADKPELLLSTDKGFLVRRILGNGNLLVGTQALDNVSLSYFNVQKKSLVSLAKLKPDALQTLRTESDGKTLAYMFNDSGTYNIFIRELAGKVSPTIYSTTNTLYSLAFNEASTEIIFEERSPDNYRLKVANVRTGSIDTVLSSHVSVIPVKFIDRKRIITSDASQLALFDSETRKSTQMLPIDKNLSYLGLFMVDKDHFVFQVNSKESPVRYLNLYVIDLEKRLCQDITMDHKGNTFLLVSPTSDSKFMLFSSKNSASTRFVDLYERSIIGNSEKQLTSAGQEAAAIVVNIYFHMGLLFAAASALGAANLYFISKRKRMLHPLELNDAEPQERSELELKIDSALRLFSDKPTVAAMLPASIFTACALYGLASEEIFETLKPSAKLVMLSPPVLACGFVHSMFVYMYDYVFSHRKPELTNDLRTLFNNVKLIYALIRDDKPKGLGLLQQLSSVRKFKDVNYYGLQALVPLFSSQDYLAFEGAAKQLKCLIRDNRADSYLQNHIVFKTMQRPLDILVYKVYQRFAKNNSARLDAHMQSISATTTLRNADKLARTIDFAKKSLPEYSDGFNAIQSLFMVFLDHKSTANSIFDKLYAKAQAAGLVESALDGSKVYSLKGLLQDVFRFKQDLLPKLEGEVSNLNLLSELVDYNKRAVPMPLAIFPCQNDHLAVLYYEDGTRLSDLLQSDPAIKSQIMPEVIDFQAFLQTNIKSRKGRADGLKRLIGEIESDTLMPYWIKARLIDNLPLTFRSFDVFPHLYDLDGHTDNYLVTKSGKIIGLDFPDRFEDICLYTTAKLLDRRLIFENSPSGFLEKMQYVKESMFKLNNYLPSNARFHYWELLELNYCFAALHKALSLHSKSSHLPSQKDLRLTFVKNAAFDISNALGGASRFYSPTEVNQLETLLCIKELQE